MNRSSDVRKENISKSIVIYEYPDITSSHIRGLGRGSQRCYCPEKTFVPRPEKRSCPRHNRELSADKRRAVSLSATTFSSVNEYSRLRGEQKGGGEVGGGKSNPGAYRLRAVFLFFFGIFRIFSDVPRFGIIVKPSPIAAIFLRKFDQLAPYFPAEIRFSRYLSTSRHVFFF